MNSAQEAIDAKLLEMKIEHEARIAEMDKEFNIEERLEALLAQLPRG